MFIRVHLWLMFLVIFRKCYGRWEGGVCDHGFGPLRCFLFAGLIGGDVPVGGFDILGRHTEWEAVWGRLRPLAGC